MDQQTRFDLLYGGVYDVDITLTECIHYGCLHFKVTVGAQFVDVRACNTTDYFPGFIRWLEAIAVGVEECAFVADEEGRIDKKFVYASGKDGILIIKNYGDEAELLVAPVKTKQMVKALYEGIRAFAISPIYVRKSWEGEILKDRLLEASFLPDSEAESIDHMLTLSVRELKELIHKVAPVGMVGGANIDDGINPHPDFSEPVSSSPDPNNPQNTIEVFTHFWYWDVPDEYDRCDIETKKAYLTETMKEKASWSHQGTKFGNIHSEIIEKWLDKE